MATGARRKAVAAGPTAGSNAQLAELNRKMRALEAQLDYCAARFDVEQRGFDGRLQKVETRIPAASPAKFPWDKVPPWLQAILTPLIVALIGWWLTGSLDLAIKQQQADIQGVKEMRDALAELYAAAPEKSRVDAAALSIAAFGGVAAAPLIEAVNRGGDARPEAARRGLIAAAAVNKERVCDTLKFVSGASPSLYEKEARELAKQLQGELQC